MPDRGTDLDSTPSGIGRADNGGVGIHFETVGHGPPLVLHHGRLGSGRFWTDAGYVEALAPSRRLIVLDARGHGRSDKPDHPGAYRAEDMAGDVVAVLDRLDIERADFLGYSMGGRIGFATLAHHPDRLNCLLAGGAGPYGPARSAEAERHLAETLAGGMAAYLAEMRKMLAPTSGRGGRTLDPAEIEALLANDAPALAALATATADWAPVVDAVAAAGRPVFLFGGTDDPIWPLIERASTEIATAELSAVGPFGHGEDLRRPDLVLPLVTDFLDRLGLGRPSP